MSSRDGGGSDILQPCFRDHAHPQVSVNRVRDRKREPVQDSEQSGSTSASWWPMCFTGRRLKFLPVHAYRDRLSIMASELSPQIEQYLASVVAGGLFPSKEAALEAAIAALREKTEPTPFVPDEHTERLEQAIESANAGHCREMTDADWDNLRQIARDAASGNPPSSL